MAGTSRRVGTGNCRSGPWREDDIYVSGLNGSICQLSMAMDVESATQEVGDECGLGGVVVSLVGQWVAWRFPISVWFSLVWVF